MTTALGDSRITGMNILNLDKRSVLGALALAAITALTWWVWLGQDTEYQVDPSTGSETGPYEPVQVIACVLSIVVIAAIGGLLLRPWLVVAAMTVSFTVAWSLQAAATDDSGLWAVGAVLVAGGMLLGTAACAFGARAVGKSA
jgi:hypothetical protein